MYYNKYHFKLHTIKGLSLFVNENKTIDTNTAGCFVIYYLYTYDDIRIKWQLKPYTAMLFNKKISKYKNENYPSLFKTSLFLTSSYTSTCIVKILNNYTWIQVYPDSLIFSYICMYVCTAWVLTTDPQSII